MVVVFVRVGLVAFVVVFFVGRVVVSVVVVVIVVVVFTPHWVILIGTMDRATLRALIVVLVTVVVVLGRRRQQWKFLGHVFLLPELVALPTDRPFLHV